MPRRNKRAFAVALSFPRAFGFPLAHAALALHVEPSNEDLPKKAKPKPGEPDYLMVHLGHPGVTAWASGKTKTAFDYAKTWALPGATPRIR